MQGRKDSARSQTVGSPEMQESGNMVMPLQHTDANPVQTALSDF